MPKYNFLVLLVFASLLISLVANVTSYRVQQDQISSLGRSSQLSCERSISNRKIIDILVVAAIEVVKDEGVTPQEKKFIAIFRREHEKSLNQPPPHC